MTGDDVRALIERKVAAVGGLRTFAELLDVSPGYVSDILAGRREPGPFVCQALGIVRESTVSYHYGHGGN